MGWAWTGATRSRVHLRGTGQERRHQCKSNPPPSTPHSKGTAYAQALVSISRHTQILELLEKQGQTHGGYSKYLRGSG